MADENQFLKTLKTLTNEDIQVRIDGVRSLFSLAKELGPKRTSDELLPQLSGLLEDDDELLLVLADELNHFTDFLDEAKAGSLLSLLSTLCQAEEEAVRKKATNTLVSLSGKLTSESFTTTYITLVTNLGASTWFTSKMSCCALLPSAAGRATEAQKEPLVKLFLALAKDQTPMARRAAATHLKDFIKYLSYDQIIPDFVELFKTISQDQQDSVRLLAIEVGAALAHAFSKIGKPEQTVAIVQPVVLACAEDKSWRVRYMVANCFVSLASELEQKLVVELLPVFLKLLGDSEQEVRTAAAGKVSGLAKLIPIEQSISSLLPAINALVRDESESVRAALAKDVMVLAPSFGPEGTKTHLLNIFLQLLKDDVPEVRLNVISKLDQVTPFVGLEKLSEHLIPAIIELGEDKSWRVRLSVMGGLPPLASQLDLDFFVKSLGELCFSWLGDTVYAIRQASIQNLKNITQVYGEPFSKVVVPRISKLCSNTNYLHRMTILFYVEHVGPLMSQEFLRTHIVPLVSLLAQDPVANIRYATARALEALLKNSNEPQTVQEFTPIVKKLLEDKDPDVFEAAQAANTSL